MEKNFPPPLHLLDNASEKLNNRFHILIDLITYANTYLLVRMCPPLYSFHPSID